MRVVWIASWVLAFAGPVVYLTQGWWYVGVACVLPLAALAAWRADSYGSGADAGPWSPPPA